MNICPLCESVNTTFEESRGCNGFRCLTCDHWFYVYRSNKDKSMKASVVKVMVKSNKNAIIKLNQDIAEHHVLIHRYQELCDHDCEVREVKLNMLFDERYEITKTCTCCGKELSKVTEEY